MNSGERLSPLDRPSESTYIDYGPELPARYGLLSLRALVRDPRSVFAYWEWPSPDPGKEWAARLREAGADRGPVIRLDRAAAQAGSCHFDALPDRSYEAELGWLDGGWFVAVKTSNRVRTPRDRAATEIDAEWAPGPGESEILGAWTVHIFTPGSRPLGPPRSGHV